jgi:hypothetical protein
LPVVENIQNAVTEESLGMDSSGFSFNVLVPTWRHI